jgi:microcystin-dependent protein
MATPYLAEIRTFAFNFAPAGWAFCNGQLLSISNNAAVFALIGTTYGGDGQTTFALPNLQSRVPIHQGQGSGLSSYIISQSGGVENVTLTVNQIPAHNHLVNAAGDLASHGSPNMKILGASDIPLYVVTPPTSPVTMSSTMISIAGGGQAHPNVQPYLTINFCIALEGIFPSRN